MDEVANELVVVLRGTDNLPDVLTDIKIRKVPYKSEGVSECPGCKVRLLCRHYAIVQCCMSALGRCSPIWPTCIGP